MKVIHFTNKSIFPLLDGGCVALNNFQEILLAANFEVKHLSIATKKHPFSLSEIPLDRIKKVKTESIFVNTNFNLIKAIRAKISGKSYHVERFYSNEVTESLLVLLKNEKVECIILESIFLSSYLPFLRSNFSGKIYCRSHNLESELWQNKAKQEKNKLKKWIFQSMSSDLIRLERDILPKMDGIICISKADELAYKKQGIKNSCTIPLHLKVDKSSNFIPKAELFFIGSMNWFPNQEAVKWIKNELFPLIQSKRPETELHLAGSFSEAKNTSHSGCFEHGRVPDVNMFMKEHGILIAPFKSASGVRVKMLEAMRLGVPIISNKKGFQGIEITAGKHGICAETEEELVVACLDLLENENKRVEIGRNAQEFVAENYTIEPLSKQISAFIQSN